jgi:hypothetical protein
VKTTGFELHRIFLAGRTLNPATIRAAGSPTPYNGTPFQIFVV